MQARPFKHYKYCDYEDCHSSNMDNGESSASDFVPSAGTNKRRRIDSRSGFLKVKKDLSHIQVEDFDNPWTLACTFLRDTLEYLQWLMDKDFLRSAVVCNKGKCKDATCTLQVSKCNLHGGNKGCILLKLIV